MALGARIMPGFYLVDAGRCDDALLERCLEMALGNARSLPPKQFYRFAIYAIAGMLSE